MSRSEKDGLVARLRRVFDRRPGSGEDSAARARFPHLVRGWLDPNVPLQAWRTTVDAEEAAIVLRAIAAASDGRVAQADVGEVLDCVAGSKDGAARAFRFGERRAYLQLWIGAVPKGGSVQLTLLSDLRLVERVARALSVEAFPPGPARDEWDRLRRFFLAAFRWQALRAPPAALDVDDVVARMERITGDPGAQLLELVRGLRRRVRGVLDDLASLGPAEVADADAWLAARGAPTLTEMRSAHPAPADSSDR